MESDTFNTIATFVLIGGAAMVAILAIGVFFKLVGWLFR